MTPEERTRLRERAERTRGLEDSEMARFEWVQAARDMARFALAADDEREQLERRLENLEVVAQERKETAERLRARAEQAEAEVLSLKQSILANPCAGCANTQALLDAEQALRAAADREVARLRRALEDIRDGYDCEEDAHRYSNAASVCRCCIARAALQQSAPQGLAPVLGPVAGRGGGAS